MKHSSLRRISATSLATLVIATVGASTASAHVHVTPDTATPGSYATLTFKVPNESSTASTMKLEVDLPTDHPFSYAAYQPVPGWSAKVTMSKLAKPVTTDDGTLTEAPTKIVWTANAGSAIKPGQFQTFPISLGPVPDAARVTFAAHQTYSDGTVVDWSQEQKGSQEPEHPAPVLYIKDKAPDAAGASPSASASASAAAPDDSAAVSSKADASDATARWLGTGGIVVGLVGILFAAFVATRRGVR